ncbi:unnamed protein product [Gongylonema pulchrum]|uniref:ARID domain-containing protein n=1 Tax=Gongylonema pulchrum TaxID=637853 RepID=A0A183DQJ8_9BILA|nr:unnamed protein product [Gongylonema pulchrum]
MSSRFVYTAREERLMWEFLYQSVELIDGGKWADRPASLKLWRKFQMTGRTSKTSASLSSQLEFKANISICLDSFGLVTAYEKEDNSGEAPDESAAARYDGCDDMNMEEPNREICDAEGSSEEARQQRMVEDVQEEEVNETFYAESDAGCSQLDVKPCQELKRSNEIVEANFDKADAPSETVNQQFSRKKKRKRAARRKSSANHLIEPEGSLDGVPENAPAACSSVQQKTVNEELDEALALVERKSELSGAEMPEAPGTTKQQSLDDVEKEVISKIPNLDIAQLRFVVSHPDVDAKTKAEKWEKLVQLIRENEMGPYYKLICGEVGFPLNEALLAELKEANEKRLKEIDDEIKDAEQNLGLIVTFFSGYFCC